MATKSTEISEAAAWRHSAPIGAMEALSAVGNFVLFVAKLD